MTYIIHALYRLNGSVEKRYYLFVSFNCFSMFSKWKKKFSMRLFELSLKKLSAPNNNYWMLRGGGGAGHQADGTSSRLMHD